MIRFYTLLLALFLISSCAVNPVTGRNEINLVPLAQQKAIGAQQYGPSQQSQGGIYKVDPELTRYVSEVGQRVAAVSDTPLDYEFVVLNNSVPNAWALPGGKIAVNRGLLMELDSEAELAAVLGHEVVHAAAGHGAQAMTRGTLLQGALAVGAVATRDSEYSDYIVGASTLGIQLVTQRYGRDAERESDFYGIHYMLRAGYDPNAAVSLQQTFVRLSEGNNPGWIDGLFASHPPSLERVQNNRALVNELRPQIQGRDLEIGKVRYQQATAYMQETAPAYELFDEALKAVADDDLDIAYGNLDEAIAMVGTEARFHGLQGDILMYQEHYSDAVKKYNKAIALDDAYYDYYLGRGVAHSRLKQNALAKTDLEHSSRLLPTALAQNELGKLSLAAGDRAQAKQFFQNAAAAEGLVGQQASAAFARLDVEDNPAAYVTAQAFVDNQGRVMARISNQSPHSLRNIRVNFSVVVADSLQREDRSIPVLNSNTYTDAYSGIQLPSGTTLGADQIAVVVLGASL